MSAGMATVSTNKILTVSVAAYNVGDYLDQCLASCVVPEIIDFIEVIVVDDGSVDNCADIAEGYVRQYPDTFRLVRKENGGYGTTVNTSLPLARGKYYKLLDGDDWFDQGGLVSLVRVLENANVDWVLTDMVQADACDGDTRYAGAGQHFSDKTVTLDEAGEDVVPSMWYSAFKTSLLQNCGFTLPSHCLYTDVLFVAHGIAASDTLYYLPRQVYCYRTNAREEQSIALGSMMKHRDEVVAVYMGVAKIAAAMGHDAPEALKKRLLLSYTNAMDLAFLMPASVHNANKLKGYDKFLKALSPYLYEYVGGASKTVRLLRRTNYMFYWPRRVLELHRRRGRFF